MAKDKDKSAKPGSDEGIRLARHPRARRDIGLAKGWGGLGVFVLALLLSLKAGLPLPDALARAIVGGVVGYVVAWAGVVAVWRHVLLAEMESHRRKVLAQIEAHEADRGRRDAEAAA
jgi:uncharacterized membrane protein YccC